MSTFDPAMNHRNDNAVAAETVDGDDAAVGRHARPPAEAETDADAFETTGQESNLSALNEVAHPFDQTNGIVEEVDRHHGETHHNDEQLDADPDVDPDLDPTAEDDEPGRESPSDRRPLINTTLVAEEIFGDDERKKPRFD